MLPTSLVPSRASVSILRCPVSLGLEDLVFAAEKTSFVEMPYGTSAVILTRWDASRPGVIPKHSEHEGGLAFCRIGKALVPHPDKTETGGEDACFALKTFPL